MPTFKVSTNSTDYAPNSEAIFTAMDAALGGAVNFEVFHLGTDGSLLTDLSGTGVVWSVVDGGAGDLDGVANGVIQTSWHVNADAANQAFVLMATDAASGATATTSFTDAATMIDLTFQNTVTVNGAIFSTNVATVGAGTGLIDPFVRISTNNPTEQGYNTDFPQVVLDNAAKGDTNFVHSLNITDLPVEIVNGV